MKKILPALVAFAALSDGASASGGISCAQSEGPNIIDIGAAVTHGMGGPVFQLGASVEIADRAIPADLAKTAFGLDHLAQYWLDGEELRLLLYREREGDKPHGYVELTVLTKANEEDGYDGLAQVKVYDTSAGPEGQEWSFEAPVACSVE